MSEQERRCKRVNAAFNFYADTADIDYVGMMSAREIVKEDRSNAILYRLKLMPDLKACGYYRGMPY